MSLVQLHGGSTDEAQLPSQPVRSPILLLTLAACSGGSVRPVGPTEITEHTAMAEDDPAPPYGKDELAQALAAEREQLARADAEARDAETKVSDEAHLRTAIANAAIRRRFVQTLEVCAATARLCPPRLDDRQWSYAVESDTDPPLDVPLRFDLESWRKVAAELTERSCTCRTIDCIESAEAAIARLEVRPMPDVQADDEATASITRARDCLMRLRGKRSLPRIAP